MIIMIKRNILHIYIINIQIDVIHASDVYVVLIQVCHISTVSAFIYVPLIIDDGQLLH